MEVLGSSGVSEGGGVKGEWVYQLLRFACILYTGDEIGSLRMS